MISTHILDTAIGLPASGVYVTLEKNNKNQWIELESHYTDKDGRIKFSIEGAIGLYQLHFHAGDYFKHKDIESFYTSIPVVFQIQDLNRSYHVPLLLNPFGYSTYRGS